MTSSRTGPARPLMWLALLTALLLVFTVAPHALGYVWRAPIRLLVVLAFVAIASWLTGIYWRRIDEAAKEAQKTAYFWGGSLGAGAAFALSLWLSGPAGAGAYGVLIRTLHLPPLLLSVVIVVVIQTVGFLLGWAIWWGAKR